MQKDYYQDEITYITYFQYQFYWILKNKNKKKTTNFKLLVIQRMTEYIKETVASTHLKRRKFVHSTERLALIEFHLYEAAQEISLIKTGPNQPQQQVQSSFTSSITG